MSSADVRPRLSVKIFNMDYYFASPIIGVDENYSLLRGAYAPKLPIIRIFGTTAIGQKICTNIHGVLPYFFVPLPMAVSENIDSYLRNFCSSLEHAVQKHSNANDMVVFSATLVRARSIYGFSEKESYFIKVTLLDPSVFPQCSEVLLNGEVVGRSLQPLETHLPFLLKFCIDYNLYGMNYLHTDNFMMRASLTDYDNAKTGDFLNDLWHPCKLSSDQILLPDRAPRWTSTELEVDVSARDILNRLELENVSDSNPGLVALWAEERARRASHSVSSAPLPEMPNPDDLLPLTKCGTIALSESERKWLEQWEQLRLRFRMQMMENDLQVPMEIPNDVSDLVSDWLQDSQSSESGEWNLDATEREQRNQHSVPELDILQQETKRKTSQSSAAPSCVSVMTSLSSVSRQELLRLAQATEEADAPVPQINESLGTDWSFLRSAAEKSFMGQSQNFFSEVHSSILSVCNPDHSQDLLATQSSLGSPVNGLSSCTLTAGHSAVHSRSNVVGDFDTDDSEDIDALLVAHATKAAVSYLSGQLTQSSHDMSKQVALAGEDASHLEVEDDLVMSKRIHSDEDAPPSIPDAFWASLDEPFEENEYRSHELVSLHPDSPTSVDADLLEAVCEWDEWSDGSCIEPNESCTATFTGHSPARKSNDGDAPDVVNGDATSQSLFISRNDDDDVEHEREWSRIPQVDGPADDEQSDDSTKARSVRTHRRRLGLRLTTNHMNPLQSNLNRINSQLDTENSVRSKCPRLSGVASKSHSRRSGQSHSSATKGCKEATDSEAASASLQMNQLKMCPTVVVERLDESLLAEDCPGASSQRSVNSVDLLCDSRRSPVEDFEDFPASNGFQDQTASMLSLSAVHKDGRYSSTLAIETSESQLTLGQLTLFSNTHDSPTHPVSPLPITPMMPVTSIHLRSSWRPTKSPPSYESVSQWYQTCSNNTTGFLLEESAVRAESAVESSNSESCLLMGETDIPSAGVQRTDPSAFLITSIVEQDDQSTATQSVAHSPQKRDSSMNSVSVLYQAASQRCFLSVQLDHVTIASLELHCFIRTGSNRRHVPAADPHAVRIFTHPDRQSSHRGGFLPDPAIDPVCLAALSVRRSTGIVDLFVLINCATLPGQPTDAPVDSTSYRSGLTSSYMQPGCDKKTRSHLLPKWIWCTDEFTLLSWVVYIVQRFDPELLVGYDVERASWGYLVNRASCLQRQSFSRELSRLTPDIIQCAYCSRWISECGNLTPGTHTKTNQASVSRTCSCPCGSANRPSDDNRYQRYRDRGWPAGPGAGRTGGPFPCPGRVVLCLWRILMSEISLFEYSLETVVLRLLKETVPRFSGAQLHTWFTETRTSERWRTVDYFVYRSLVNLRLISSIDLVGRTSEFARVFGIEFYHVLSRGSQYRVESLLCRTARAANFLLPSPSITQRARQRAPEAIPLNLEPDSSLFVDGPVAVLDFQSLYPSVIIAYNYCYSTVLGRLTSLARGEDNSFDLGCLAHHVPAGLIESLESNVNVAPNGVVFVKSIIREGILPRMLKQLLRARLMVKDSMKLYKTDKSLTRLLDVRQLGLKLMANVIFGYTAASFSGRMPCVEVGDSIVHKSRETLEQAIELVHSDQIPLPQSCTPRVVYGDTDSLFIHLPGLGRAEAFAVAEAIAQAVTASNPAPIKLKLEKIYYPCLLEAKKRYAGYMYESVSQTEPVFDAKGLETVRRDCSPFVSEMLESTLRLLFNQFSLPGSIQSLDFAKCAVNDKSVMNHLLRTAEARVRDLVRVYAQKLLIGAIPFGDCILTRPYWGQSSYRPGAFAPALQVARRLMAVDSRAEPAVGERVAYYVAPGRPGQTLISCIRSVSELSPPVWSPTGATTRRSLSPRLNTAYYLDKQLIPPLIRMAQLLGWRVDLWLNDLPRFHTVRGNPRFRARMRTTASMESSLKRLDSIDSQSSTFSQSSSLMSVYGDSGNGLFDRSSQNRTRKARRRHPAGIMRAFVRQPLRICVCCDTRVPQSVPLDQFGCCQSCLRQNPGLSVISAVEFGSELNRVNRELHHAELICTGCLRHRGGHCDAVWLCANLLCPVQSVRLRATAQLAAFSNKYPTQQLADGNSTFSW